LIYQIPESIQAFTENALIHQLQWASYKPDPAALSKNLKAWLRSGRHAVWCYEERSIVGIVVVEDFVAFKEIINIGVDPEKRGRRIGTKLVNHVRKANPGIVIKAETDENAVGFYRKLGFRVEAMHAMDEKCARFECSLGI
jgi:ribosomal protein S18 acetylase RimI-like enzyme